MGGWAGRRAERRRHSPGRSHPDEHRSLPRTPAPRQRPSTVGAPSSQGCSRDVAGAWDGGATILGWRGACLHAERKLAKRFPLPAPKMATPASPPHGTHALYSASTRPSGRTGLLQVTVGTLKGGRGPALRRRHYLPVPGPSPPAEEGPGSAQPAQLPPHPARNTPLRPAHGRGGPDARGERALRPTYWRAHAVGAGLHVHWAVNHARLGKWGKGGGRNSAIGPPLLSINVTSGDGHGLGSLIGEACWPRRAGLQVRWEEEAGREAEAGEALGRPAAAAAAAAAARRGFEWRTCCGSRGGRRAQQRVPGILFSLTRGGQRRGAETSGLKGGGVEPRGRRRERAAERGGRGGRARAWPGGAARPWSRPAPGWVGLGGLGAREGVVRGRPGAGWGLGAGRDGAWPRGWVKAGEVALVRCRPGGRGRRHRERAWRLGVSRTRVSGRVGAGLAPEASGLARSLISGGLSQERA